MRTMKTSAWQAFDINKIKSKLTGAPASYEEILQAPPFSCIHFTLRAGTRDMQSPHN
jgi:hypothetical protein